MGPRPDRTIVAWTRSNTPGYVYGGNKFDLDKWNPEFFARLKDFVAKATERGIVVEVNFFNSQYTDRWPLSPLHYQNNIQGVGKCDFKDAQTLKYPDLVQREIDYVRKITQEVNGFDNAILEICDKASLFTSDGETGPWVGHLMEVVHNTEVQLPKKHLVAQQVQGWSADPSISRTAPCYRSSLGNMCGELNRARRRRWEGLLILTEGALQPALVAC